MALVYIDTGEGLIPVSELPPPQPVPTPSGPAQVHPVQPAKAQTTRPAVRTGAYIDTGAGYIPAASLPPPAHSRNANAKPHPIQPSHAANNGAPAAQNGAGIRSRQLASRAASAPPPVSSRTWLYYPPWMQKELSGIAQQYEPARHYREAYESTAKASDAWLQPGPAIRRAQEEAGARINPRSVDTGGPGSGFSEEFGQGAPSGLGGGWFVED